MATLGPVPVSVRRTTVHRLKLLVIVAAVGYPLGLLAVALGLYYLGEDWWLTAAGLYAPRLALGAPLVVLTALLLGLRLRRWIWTQLLALFVLVFPLMGLVLPWPTSANPEMPRLKVLSFNVNSGYLGYDRVARDLLEFAPDVVLLQEVEGDAEKLAALLRPRFQHVHVSTQFVVASRFPLLQVTDPERLGYFGRDRSPRYMRYLIGTPLGPIAFYNVHPLSPRGAMNVYRLRAVLHALRTLEPFSKEAQQEMRDNVGLRALQIRSIALDAAQERSPLVIAGDLNLPGLSSLFRRNLARYTDGFQAAQSGFGYTFPVKFPFMRLDRILSSGELRFTSFQVGCKGASDHLCVVAELQSR